MLSSQTIFIYNYSVSIKLSFRNQQKDLKLLLALILQPWRRKKTVRSTRDARYVVKKESHWPKNDNQSEIGFFWSMTTSWRRKKNFWEKKIGVWELTFNCTHCNWINLNWKRGTNPAIIFFFLLVLTWNWN